MVIIGAVYKHHKNQKDYLILNRALHTETDEMMVVYMGLYDDPKLGKNPVFTRPEEMFEEIVEYQGKKVERFKKVG